MVSGDAEVEVEVDGDSAFVSKSIRTVKRETHPRDETRRKKKPARESLHLHLHLHL